MSNLIPLIPWSDNLSVHQINGDHILPMAKVEDNIFGLIIQMTRIRHPLTPSNFLQLENDFISVIQTEKDVIDF